MHRRVRGQDQRVVTGVLEQRQLDWDGGLTRRTESLAAASSSRREARSRSCARRRPGGSSTRDCPVPSRLSPWRGVRRTTRWRARSPDIRDRPSQPSAAHPITRSGPVGGIGDHSGRRRRRRTSTIRAPRPSSERAIVQPRTRRRPRSARSGPCASARRDHAEMSRSLVGQPPLTERRHVGVQQLGASVGDRLGSDETAGH